MSNRTVNTSTVPDVTTEVNEGLVEFFSSLAHSALSQYDTILNLLGRTTDWTAPGMACEVIIRQLIRNTLPTQFSVDKGFIHGRRAINGESKHSPEIDVLIHDSHTYAPILRIDDFVIVQPASVRGVVQVKRTMTSATLKKAIENIVEAKLHIRECLGNAIRFHKLENVFSAFITFRDEIVDPTPGQLCQTYQNRLKAHFKSFDDGYTAPHFVGSLDRRAFVFSGLNVNEMGYSVCQCTHSSQLGTQQNVGLQLFLLQLAKSVMPLGNGPAFAFPDGYVAEGAISTFKASAKTANKEQRQVTKKQTTKKAAKRKKPK